MKAEPKAARNAEIRRRHAAGETIKSLSLAYGIETCTIGVVLKTGRRRAAEERLAAEWAGRTAAPADLVEELPLSAKVKAALRRKGVATAAEAAALDDRRMLAMPGFGRRSLDQLRAIVPAERREPQPGRARGPGSRDAPAKR